MEYTFRDLLSAIFRHMRMLVAFWVLTLIAVLVFYSQSRKLYESKAKILVSLGSEAQGKAEYLNEKNLQLLQREQQIHDEQQILESHEVLFTTAQWILGDPTPGFPAPPRDARVEQARRFITGEQPEPTLLLRAVHSGSELLGKISSTRPTHKERLEDITRELSNDLSVSLIFDSDALDVSYRYRDPGVAQTILSLILQSYIEHHIQVFQSGPEATLLKAQYDTSVKQYHDRLAEMSQYMTDHGVYSDDSQMNDLMEQREKLAQSLNQAAADESADMARLASLTSIGQSLQRFEQYSSTEVRNKERDELLAKLDEATLEETNLLTRHPEGSRAYKDEQAKLDEIRQLVKSQPATVTDSTEQRRTKSSELIDSDVITATEAQRSDQARVSSVAADQRKNDDAIKKYAAGLQGYDSLKFDVALAKDESEEMAKAYVDSHLKTLTSQDAITDVSLIDSPTWDWRPATPKKGIVAAAAVVLLLIGSVALLISAVALEQTIADPRGAAIRLGSEVVGAFPLEGEPLESRDSLQAFEAGQRSEFARIVQSLPPSGPEGRVILLAESYSGEGATLIGYGLALFLSSEAGEKTAFYDSTAHPLAASMGPAASGQLTIAQRPAAGQDTAALLQELRRDHRNVVIAAGPVKEAAGLMAIRSLSPTTFLLVEAARTRHAVARFSMESLRKFGFRDVRVVLNKRRLYIPEWIMRFV